MTLDLTTNGGPIWLSRSRINRESEEFGLFTVGENLLLLKRIIDGDPRSFWHDNTGLDADIQTMTISFQDGTIEFPRSIDFVALQNINLKNFLLEYSLDGVAYFTIPGGDYQIGVLDNALTDFVLNFPTIASVVRIRLTMYRTITVDQQKKVGGFYACLSTLQLAASGIAKGFSTYDKRYKEKARYLELGDGGLSVEYVFRSATSYQHFAATARLRFASEAERDALFAIKDSGDPFSFYPLPGIRNREIFTSNFQGAWRDKYLSKFTDAGFEINFNIREVGRL